MMTEDFTKLPIGVLVSDSRTIVRCSVCRRRGALDVKLRRCVHVEGSAIGADGLVIEPIDSCAPVWAIQVPISVAAVS
ncbi:MAG TPA: hypothetical protein VKG23_01385 [Thermoanaerobaculia bacterium]|jgi:hypothetical protein|nr:hypothetical protein [Thermoanaerobaculia bacterium]